MQEITNAFVATNPLDSVATGTTLTEELPHLVITPTVPDYIHKKDEVASEVRQSGQKLMHVIQAGKGQVKAPFFFFHGDWNSQGAPPLYTFMLSRTAGRRQPFYAFEPWYIKGGQSLPPIEEQATAYLKLIRDVQPEGPYTLGGYCNGALMAFHIAQQLQNEGQQVRQLTLIDPPILTSFAVIAYCSLVQYIGKLIFSNERAQRRLFLHSRHVVRRLFLHIYPGQFFQQRFRDNLLTLDQDFDRLFPALSTLNKEAMTVWEWLLSNCKWTSYKGKLTVIWSEGKSEMRKKWNGQRVAKDSETHIIPGNHLSILNEHVHALAERLCESLP